MISVPDMAQFVNHHIIKFADRNADQMEAVIDAVFCVTGAPAGPGLSDAHSAAYKPHTGRIEGRTGLQDGS